MAITVPDVQERGRPDVNQLDDFVLDALEQQEIPENPDVLGCFLDQIDHCLRYSIDYTFGPINVVLNKYEIPLSRRFRIMTRMCIVVLENGCLCSRPVEGMQRCDHLSILTGNWMWVYNFKLRVSFDNANMNLCVSDGAARSFLGVSAQELACNSNAYQKTFLYNYTIANPFGKIFITCKNCDTSITSASFRNVEIAEGV